MSRLTLALTAAGTAGLVALTTLPAAAYTVFVTNEKDNSISVIDGEKLEVTKTIKVGQRPRGIILSKDGKWIIVCTSDDNIIQVYDAKTYEFIKTLASGPDPELLILHPDGKTLYIANEDDNLVTVVDIETGAVISDIPVGVEPEGMGMSPDGVARASRQRPRAASPGSGTGPSCCRPQTTSPPCARVSRRAAQRSPTTPAGSSRATRPRSLWPSSQPHPEAESAHRPGGAVVPSALAEAAHHEFWRMGMSEHVADVKKYASDADEEAVAGIVKHLGIALRNRDSSLVSASDPDELARVRESWLKKKLALTHSDADLDAAIKSVADAMKGDNSKSRVTFYYLLAKHYGKLGDLK